MLPRLGVLALGQRIDRADLLAAALEALASFASASGAPPRTAAARLISSRSSVLRLELASAAAASSRGWRSWAASTSAVRRRAGLAHLACRPYSRCEPLPQLVQRPPSPSPPPGCAERSGGAGSSRSARSPQPEPARRSVGRALVARARSAPPAWPPASRPARLAGPHGRPRRARRLRRTRPRGWRAVDRGGAFHRPRRARPRRSASRSGSPPRWPRRAQRVVRAPRCACRSPRLGAPGAPPRRAPGRVLGTLLGLARAVEAARPAPRRVGARR